MVFSGLSVHSLSPEGLNKAAHPGPAWRWNGTSEVAAELADDIRRWRASCSRAAYRHCRRNNVCFEKVDVGRHDGLDVDGL